MTPAAIGFAVLIPLIAWRLYRRIRRLVVRQKSRAWRHWVAAVFFPALLVLLATAALSNPLALAALVAGMVTGVVLSVWGLRLTRFEMTPEGIFYTPNAHIGIALSLLLVARIAYRLVEIGMAQGLGQAGAQDFARSPLTLVIFGTLASYYAGYAVGVLRRRRELQRA
jgi:membrane protein CcdC involved in cytochrome C biogenesis